MEMLHGDLSDCVAGSFSCRAKQETLQNLQENVVMVTGACSLRLVTEWLCCGM